MNSIMDERQLTEYQKEEIELQKIAPQKFDPEIEFKINKSASDKSDRKVKNSQYRVLTMEEVSKLIAASDAPHPTAPPNEHRSYSTYSRDEVERMVQEHFQYGKEDIVRKEEKKDWDLAKTTALGIKTAVKTKRSKVTKA